MQVLQSLGPEVKPWGFEDLKLKNRIHPYTICYGNGEILWINQNGKQNHKQKLYEFKKSYF